MKEFYTKPELVTGQDEMELVLMEAPRMPFWKKLLIYISIWLVVIFIACCIMWSIMEQYEAAQPERAMDAYVELSKQEIFFNSMIYTMPDFKNKYEPLYDAAGRLADTFTGSISYSKSLKDSTRENPVYIIKHESEDIFKVTLEYDDSTGFMGFMNYRVKSTELLKTELLELDRYYLVFPTSSIVTVNSIQLDKKITGNYEEVDIFGSDHYRAILLGDFLLEPKIKTNVYGYSNGMIAYLYSPEVKIEGEYRIYQLEEDNFKTLTIDAPERAQVTIGGKNVSEHFITDAYTVAMPEGDSVRMVEYTIPTVMGNTFVSAYLDGVPLTVTNNGDFYTVMPNEDAITSPDNNPSEGDIPPQTEANDYRVLLPKDATLYLNGTAVGADRITASDVMWYSAFEELANYPTATEYTLTDIGGGFEITASINGVPLVKQNDGEAVVFVYPPSEELKESYSVSALDFVSRYLHYISQGYRNTEANLNNVLSVVIKNSHAYKTLNKTYDGIRFNSPQTMEIKTLTADNFVPFGNDTFVCEVSYSATFTDNVNNEKRENSIFVVFEKSGNAFKPSKFILG